MHASTMLRRRCTTLLLAGGLLASGSLGRAEPATTAAAVTNAPAATTSPAPEASTTATAASGAATPLVSTEILLDLSQREIALVRDGKTVNRWPVVIGAPETPTPVGRFAVQSKVVNPVYQSTATGQVKGVGALGYRWIGFHSKGANVFGIHGTPWPWWVDARAAVSHGCVRMRNEHIEKLFAAVEVGTPVIIQP